MSTIKNHDFIEVEYTGRIKEDNSVFDTTSADVAKENDLYNEKSSYGPIVVCVGENHLLNGLDKKIEGKESGKEYDFELSPEEAFGKKDAKLIQLIPTNKFKQQNIHPMPGLQVNIDGLLGLIKTVSGGRTMVDFNHPLSGKDVLYKIKISRIVADDKEKLLAMLKLSFGDEDKDFKVELREGTANVEFKQQMHEPSSAPTPLVPEEAKKQLNEKITKLIPSIKQIVFTIEEGGKSKENK